MEQFREYDEDHQIRVILSEERNEYGYLESVTYRCDGCHNPVERMRYVHIGMVLCPACRRKMTYRKRREKIERMREQDPDYQVQHFRLHEYEELDRGTVFALYRAGRSIKWIADDQRAKVEDVERMVKEIFGAERIKR